MTNTALQTVNTQLALVEDPYQTAKETAVQQYNAILAQEDSLAMRVFGDSQDKENPNSLAIIEYLQQNGFVKIQSISRLPELQAQNASEEIYKILTGKVMGFDIFNQVRQSLGKSSINRIYSKTQGPSLVHEGLLSLGIEDPKLETLFVRSDLVRFLEYASSKYPQVFEDIPASGHNLPVLQLKYYTEWKSALEQLGMSRVRQECRALGLDEAVLEDGKGEATKESVLAEISARGWLASSIQSIDVYARRAKPPESNSSLDTGLELFAFVERLEPKGLVMSYGGRFPGRNDVEKQIQTLFETGLISKMDTSLEKTPAYKAWLERQPSIVSCSLAVIGTIAGIVGGRYVESNLGFKLPDPGALTFLFTFLFGGLGGIKSLEWTSRNNQRLNALSARVKQSVPFSQLSSKGTQNYMALYQLEGKDTLKSTAK